jgi:hypothetical protein
MYWEQCWHIWFHSNTAILEKYFFVLGKSFVKAKIFFKDSSTKKCNTNMSTLFSIHLPNKCCNFGANQKCQMVASWDQKLSTNNSREQNTNQESTETKVTFAFCPEPRTYKGMFSLIFCHGERDTQIGGCITLQLHRWRDTNISFY